MKKIKNISINSKYRNHKKNITNIIFIIGLIAGIYALSQTIYDYVLESYKVPVEGTVREQEYLTEDTSLIKVEYTVNRIEYSQSFVTKEDVTVNDKYEVIYNKNNPAVTVKNEHIIEVTAGVVIFILCMLLSLKDFVVNLLRNKKINKYKTEGILIKANIQEIMVNTKARRFNKMKPFVIRLMYLNPQDGNSYIYKTENIYEDIRSTIERNEIKTVDIYINKQNTNDYYIDLDSILKV